MSPFKVQNCPLNRDTAVFGAIVADAFLEMGLDKQLMAETTDRDNIKRNIRVLVPSNQESRRPFCMAHAARAS